MKTPICDSFWKDTGNGDYVQMFTVAQRLERDLIEAKELLTKLCDDCRGDYVEDVWGERETRIKAERYLNENTIQI
jgi:hypothetical protein